MEEEDGGSPSNEAISQPTDVRIGSSLKGKILSCSFGIDKNQVGSKWVSDERNEVLFSLCYTSKEPLVASVYYFASEQYDTLHNLTTKVWGRVGETEGYHYKLDAGTNAVFQFKMKFENLKELVTQHHAIPKKGGDEHLVYPVIMRLEALKDPLSHRSPKSVLYTYLDIVVGSESSPSISATVRRQKREVNQESFDLIDVFNAEEGSENLCLICMSEEPDCIIMPCRHMVVNLECAQQIDDKKDQFDCPLCRCRAEELIYVNKPAKGQAAVQQTQEASKTVVQSDKK